ncbi:hypothetical protein A3J43_00025 [Candidatus Uhrbacteria bacterium RIFCSPHIGHO2_12_FULL_54_23]|nr:MAG: hypothetical protein A3J43_00025 [Candidatus Uhrbacteria bacterium RIFCSPHIGHO2_12_FULL_54_23]
MKRIEKAAQGDRSVFGEIYDAYAPSLYRYISFRVSHAQDREDILSNVFLRSFEAIAKGKRVIQMRAFLYQAARNAIVDYFRQRARTQEYVVEIDEEDIATIVSANTLTVDAAAELGQVRNGMRSLKPEYREIIHLRYVEDLDIGEIAAALGKSHVSIRVLLHRAMRSLKKQLGVAS